MGHDHHHHDHGMGSAGDTRILGAILVNVLLTVAQVAGGIVSGSLALIADGLHNLSDAASLIIAFAARRIGRRGSDSMMTFGYRRIELVAALVNYTTLIVLALYLAAEAVHRFFAPEQVDGWIVVWIAALALVVDVVTAVLTYALSKESMNIRAAFMHNVADALGSVGVIIAGVCVIVFGWWVVDPIITLVISGYILWMSLSEVGGVIRILMLGSPPDIATEDVLSAVREVDGVSNVHRARFWQVHEEAYAFDAHVVIDGGAWGEADAIKGRVKTVLAERFEIRQSTLELECAAHACAGAPAIGN